MTKQYLVQAEHPFHPPLRMHLHRTEASANARAVALANEILPDFWNIYADGHAEGQPCPIADLGNWKQLVEKYGEDDDFAQDDGWGVWAVWITELEIED